ncbi:MAG: c-type cytochrome [Novosphingobium sp.]
MAMVRFGGVAACVLVLALAGCGSSSKEAASQDSAAPAPASSAPVASSEDGTKPSDDGNKPPAAFAQCMSCHSVKPGQNGIGPSLAGVFGRKAGTGAGFEYSPALKGSGLTWDEASLDKWLTNPMGMVPGTRMTYAGQGDAAKRHELIEYLKSLK